MVEGHLLVGFGIHEVVQLAVVIEIFHLLGFDDGLGHLIGGVEGALNHGAGHDILDLGADKGSTLAGLYMLKVHDRPNAAIPFYGNALFEIASSNH